MSDVDDLYASDGDTFVVAVHVEPRAGRAAVLGRRGRALAVRVAAPPVDDRANDATVTLLAEELGVPTTDVELVAGARSPAKRLRVSKLDRDEFVTRLRRVVRDADPAGGPRARPRGD